MNLINGEVIADLLEYIDEKDYVGMVSYLREIANWCYETGRVEMAEQSSRVGCLWYDREKNRFSGYLDLGVMGQIKIMVFPNERRHSDKSPHFNIVLQKEKPEQKSDTQYMDIPHAATPVNGEVKADDDIPF